MKTANWLGYTGAFLFVWPIYVLAGIIDGLRKGWEETHNA